MREEGSRILEDQKLKIIMTEASVRTQWVDISKGIGILLVVYGHVQQGLYLCGMHIPEFFLSVEKNIYTVFTCNCSFSFPGFL